MGAISAREAGIAFIADPSCDFADRQLTTLQHQTRFLHAKHMTIGVGRHAKLFTKSFRDVIPVQADARRKLLDRRGIEYFPSIDRRCGFDRNSLAPDRRRATRLRCQAIDLRYYSANNFGRFCVQIEMSQRLMVFARQYLVQQLPLRRILSAASSADRLPALELNIGL